MNIQKDIQAKACIEQFLVKDFEFDSPFMDFCFNLDNCPAEMQKTIYFLSSKVNFIYGNDLLKENPFELFAWFVTGERTLGFSDLSIDDCNEINKISEFTKNHLIKGRLLDICGIKEKNKDKQLLAANNYIEYVKSQLLQEKNYSICRALERSIYLYSKNDNHKFWAILNDFIFNVKYRDTDQKIIIFAEIGRCVQKLNKELKQIFVPEFENTVSNIHEINDPALWIIRYLIDYFKKKKLQDKLKAWRIRYADLCIEIDKKYPHCYNYLKDAINVLDDTEDADKINQIRFLLEESYKRIYSQMNMVEHPIDSKIINMIDNYRILVEQQFDTITTGIGQFLFYINHFTPVSKEEFEKQQNSDARPLFNCVNNILFDENGSIVYESSKASPIETEEYLMSQFMIQHYSIVASVFFDVWRRKGKVDDELKLLLKEITHSNLLIPYDRSDVVYDILLKGLTDNEYKTCVFALLAQFENGCRLYLKNHCNIYPIITKGGQSVEIDLNHMVVQKGTKENKFRKKISELIGLDLTTNIEYLACRKLSGNLRNKNYHSGFDDTSKYTLNELALFYLLIKAYCMGYE